MNPFFETIESFIPFLFTAIATIAGWVVFQVKNANSPPTDVSKWAAAKPVLLLVAGLIGVANIVALSGWEQGTGQVAII